MSAEQLQQNQVQIEISDWDIANAERILLWEVGTFSDESKIFIRDFTTRDLCAVPWSGKTTTLHAKLLCLEKYLPFHDWSWICVLSHTNTAVDEIKDKIAIHCPHLLSYPNFIWTIQDFVNTFFVKPYFNSHTLYWKIKIIDDDVFKDQLFQEYVKIRYRKDAKNKIYWWVLYGWYIQAQSQWYSESEDTYIKNALFYSYPDYNNQKVISQKPIPWIKYKTIFNQDKFELWKTVRENIFSTWCISYNLAYYFANCSISEIWYLKNLIRKRFPFVFIDEAQDMNKLQGELLENVFWPNEWENSITICYQRIWDPNQAIYNWTDEDWYKWIIRNPLQLINSRRFSHKIAKIVEQFWVLSKCEEYNIETNIIGWCNCTNYDTCSCIQPYLIVYENAENVLDKYIEIIQYHQVHRQLSDEKYKYTAIGWRWSKPSNNDHRFLGSYYSWYIKDKTKPKKNYDSCKEYLYFLDRSKPWFAEIQKALLRSISKVIKIACWIILTTRELVISIKALNENNESYYENYKEKMRSWCKKIYSNAIDNNLIEEIKVFVEEYLTKNNITLNQSDIYNNFWSLIVTTTLREVDSWIEEKNNIYSQDWVNVYIQTIHNVKWQTHEATLYMETYYDRAYDTKRLKDFKDWSNTDKTIQTAKMLYVWLSRPRKLLCFAIHKDSYDAMKNTIDTLWFIYYNAPTPLQPTA
jgi:DNA helicase-2/ATP-dependent DNA helicase PcrA